MCYEFEDNDFFRNHFVSKQSTVRGNVDYIFYSYAMFYYTALQSQNTVYAYL